MLGLAQRRCPCTVPQRSVFRALSPASGSPRLSNHRDAPVYTSTPLQTTALLGAPHPTAPPNTSTPSAPLGYSWSRHKPTTHITLFLSPTHSLHRHYSPQSTRKSWSIIIIQTQSSLIATCISTSHTTSHDILYYIYLFLCKTRVCIISLFI